MPVNSPHEYRLIDEGTRPLRDRAPWNPLGLFFILVLSHPLLVPITALMFWLNWRRLGFGEKQKVWAVPTILLATLALLSAVAGPLLGLEISRDNARLVATFSKFALAYPYLMAQRPLFEAQRERGERTVPAKWLWAVAFVVIALPLAFWVATRPPRASRVPQPAVQPA